ncbi:hypothetical protein U3516DRAFT_666493 [Neocallimastix sp. 'constans']
MEDNIEIEISETNRGNEQIIINKKHKFNFSFQRKDKSKIYRCTEYKTLNKCKSLIILNDKNEVLKYESLHNHLEKEIDVSISVAKLKIKEEIKKNSIPMDIKPKHIFNAVSQEMGLICPEYSTIRSQIIRNINKQFPPNIKSFDDIPIESKYYKTKRNENFMIFKNTDLIIFQSPFQAYLFSNYHKNIFADEHLTNNASESYNSYLKEENLSYNDYQKRTKGTWKKKQKIFSATDEIKILIENYKSKEINLFYNECNRNELIKLWKECLIDLNDININLK